MDVHQVGAIKRVADVQGNTVERVSVVCSRRKDSHLQTVVKSILDSLRPK